MNVQMRINVIQRRVDVCAHRIVKELIVNNVCQIHMDGNIEMDANYAIVIILDRLVNRVTFLVANVCVVKVSLVANVITVQLDILVIRIVNAAIVIVMAQSLPTILNQLHAMTMDTVHVKLL